MTIIIDEFRDAIENEVKNFSWREKVYDLIDIVERKVKAEDFFYGYCSSSKYCIYESILSNYAKDEYYAIRSYLNNSDIKSYYRNTAHDSLTSLFKIARNSDFISMADESLINHYVDQLERLFPENYSKILWYGEYRKKLINKIGKEKFEEWEKGFDPENLVVELRQIVDEVNAKRDTHRYDDATVQCFLKATIADDPVEATSECQYAMHRIGTVNNHTPDEL